MSSIQTLLSENKVDVKSFINKYKQLNQREQSKVMNELKNSLAHLQDGYQELLDSIQEVKSFMSLQQEILESLTLEDSSTRYVEVSVNKPIQAVEVDEDEDYPEANVFIEDEDEDDDDTQSELISDKRGRGRAPLIHDLIEHFNLNEKAKNQEEEVQRIRNMKSVNNWMNIGTERTPHQIIMNATYLASIQMLEANSKNANYSVLTRVMLNPAGAYFEGESVIIRNRYLETRDEAEDYMERQMKKLEKQFFYTKTPSVMKNHGNRSSYYGFHLSKENRKSYTEALKLSE